MKQDYDGNILIKKEGSRLQLEGSEISMMLASDKFNRDNVRSLSLGTVLLNIWLYYLTGGGEKTFIYWNGHGIQIKILSLST